MAFSAFEVENCAPFEEKWRIFGNIGNFMYVMVRHSNGVVGYAPLYRHSFQFLQPHFLADAEKFNIDCLNPNQLETTADKLRYYRYKKGLLQKDVAEYAGIERTTYTAYEANERDYYPVDVLGCIAEILAVDITELLDDYNAFLYHGQAGQIRDLRKRLKLTQKAFAQRLGVNTVTFKRWERGKVRMTKKTWEKMFAK